MTKTNKPQRYLTRCEIRQIADEILTAHEVHPLSRRRMFEYAQERFADRFGFIPRASASWVAVNLACLGWHNAKQATRRAISSRRL